jgi:ABC-type dipeptide/oligopeptide/nickel transport system permease subunit
LFALGTGLILFVEARMLPSLQQELIALFGLIMAGAGLLWALLGYLGISILRILTYLLPNQPPTTARKPDDSHTRR